jgi:biofilm PGA synthesis N-glycosyltransferase PgaC
MNLATDFFFWGAAALLFYIYAGYPLLVALLARSRSRATRSDAARRPRFSVLIAGFNEAENLPGKLDSIYRATVADRMDEVIVGSDGSTDATPEVLAARAMSSLRVALFPSRRGKPSVLNELAPTCRSEILVFTDARQPVSADAFERMLARFDDPGVGVVSGELQFVRDGAAGGAGEGMGAYWTYEKWIRDNEGAFRSVPGATGALYAIRARLFRPIPADTILDDVLIPLNAIRQGFRCVFARGAYAFDRPSVSAAKEGIRKRRTLAGNLQLAAREPSLLNPFRNPVWFEFFSHKMLRLVSPFLLLAMLLASALRAGEGGFHAWMLGLQMAFYTLAGLGWAAESTGRRLPVAGIAHLFLSLNVSILRAWSDFLRGRFTAVWDRSDKA